MACHGVVEPSGDGAQALLVGLAHDIRSPLSSMLVLLERLLSGQCGAISFQQERHLRLVYGATFGVAGLANDALDFARSGSGLTGGAPVPFLVADVMGAVRDMVLPMAEERGIALRCSFSRELMQVGYPAAVQRVLLNLVTNAFKYTSTGSVSFSAGIIPGGAVVFEIEDTGSGMPPFGEVGKEGFGLMICRELVAEMRGTLAFEPHVPTGTRCNVLLPLSFHP